MIKYFFGLTGRGLKENRFQALNSQGFCWIASIPIVLVILNSFFAFIGQDWGWAFHIMEESESIPSINRDRAFNSGMGRFFFVTLGGAYSLWVFRKLTRSMADSRVKSDITQKFENDIEDIMRGWEDHFRAESLNIPAYTGTSASKSSQNSRELILLTINQISNDLKKVTA